MDGQTSSSACLRKSSLGAFSAPSASFDPAAPIAETISRNSKASSSCSDCSQNVHNVVTASDLELNPFLGDVINADAAALGPDLESFGDLNVSHGLAPPEDELQLRGRERSRDRRSHAERRSNSRGRRARSRSAEPERSRERKRDGGGSSREESLPLAPAFGSDPWSDPLWASMEIAPPLSAYEPHVTAALDEITATSTLVSNDHHHHHHHMHKKSSGPLKRNVTFDEKDHQHHNHHQHHHHEIYRDGEDGATHKGGEGHEHFSKEEFGEAKIRLYDRMVEDNHDHIFCSVRPLQYFVGDVLHRERTPRKVTWDELFLDLIFISTISRSGFYHPTQ
ncbi:hypothetical protein BC829DRAFT_488835 [Chytridium lagenaria]|nr:hypothetical protein BC829DRAFT_488835 [Chytridium lagenaria]